MPTVTSGNITLIDLTDTKKVDIHISSNHPTIQIYNPNDSQKPFTPDWSTTPLVLEAKVHADSTPITDEIGAKFTWSRKIGDEVYVLSSKTNTVTISDNDLESSAMVQYICSITYNDKPYENIITFARTDVGKDGTDGNSAPAVKAQYSEDGISGWVDDLDQSKHKYIRLSYDNGYSWPSKFKIAGEDGKSVAIKGTATSVASVSDTNYYTVTYGGNSVATAGLGDSYLYNGDLYVCAEQNDGEDYFINVGKIQGPQGQKGDSYYLFIRYADNINGSGISASPDGKSYIGFYRSSVNQAPTDVSSATWNWAKFVGEDAKSITLTGNAQVFKVDKSNTILPAEIKVTAQAENTTVTSWSYNTDGSTTFTNTAPSWVKQVGNVVTITGSAMTSNLVTIKASDGVRSDVFTVFKVSDGANGKPGDEGKPAPIVFLTNENITFAANAQGQVIGTTVYCNVVAYSGTTQVVPTVGTILSTELPTGMSIGTITTVSNQIRIPIVIANNATLGSSQNVNGVINIPITSPVTTTLQLTWSKINSGAKGDTGVGISSVTVTYGTSTSASTQPTSWQSSVPAVAEGSYLWTRTITDYTDDSIPDTVTYTYAKQGIKGDTGSPGSPVTVSKIEYQSGTSATTAPTGTWSSSVVSVTEGNYLWTKTAFSDGKVAYGVARQGKDGSKGDPGKGISSIVEQYYQSTSATAQSGGSWSATVPTWVDGKYIWTRSVITYTDSTTSTTSPVCVTGQKGSIGGTGVGVSSVDVWYYQSTSATALSGGSWSTTAPAWSDGKYVWTKTITTYTNSTTDETTAVCITGQKGSTGVGVKSVTEYYLATSSSSGVTISTSGWTTTVQTITLDKKYLWNYEIITYTNDTTSTTAPVIIGVFGNTGKGIKSVTEYYLATSSSSGVTTSTSGWKDTMQTLTPTNKYLWNYELITYTDNSTATISPVIIGVYGDQGIQGPKGNDAYTVMLTNESHIFAGDVSSAIAGSTTTQVLAYNGSTAQTVTIVSVNGKTAATTDTDTGIAGLKFKCSALSGVSPTITFTCTTSFVSKSGTIPIVLSVGGVSFTKMFTYSIAFKGTAGNPGSPGTPASLVDITPSALYFKSTTGKDGAFTPDYIYLYPRFQTVTFSKWEYSVNGGTTWVAASGANGISISTYNSVANTLRIAKTSALYTDTVTSISFRCVSSNASVYDTVSVAKIYDVVDLQIGGKNLVLNSNQNVTSNVYRTAVYDMSEDWIGGETYTVSIKGSINEGQSFGIWANGSGTRVATLTYDASKDIYTSTFVASTAIVTQTAKTLHVYNTPSDTATESSIEWIKLEKGNKPTTDWFPAPEDLNNITFQIYAPDGYLLTDELQSLTLKAFPYEGSIEITSDVEFQWGQLIDNTWTDISGATDTTLTVTKADVLKAKSYRCVMEYKSKTYTSTITVQDKTDLYDSVMYVSSNTTNNEYYWVLYTLVYTEAGEVDPLLGPVDISAPSSPVSGDYWYAVDTVNMSVKLKKYDGTSWVDSTDTQSLSYSWDIINDGSTKIPLSGSSKVKVVSSHHFTTTATVVCEISSLEDGLLTHSSLSLTDASDPIVSNTEPTATVNGQIWIKANDNGTYLMFIWDESGQRWISSDMDTRNKVYTSKPSSYNAGDLWITASDIEYGGHYALAKIYSPDIKYYTLTNDSYVEANPQPTSEEQVLATQYYHYVTYLQGTLLQAQFPSTTYNASDWAPTLKYDKDFDDMKETLNELKQYVDITGEGLRITARDSEGNLSPFSSLFTSDALTFYQDTNRLLTLANNQLTAPKVVIEDELEVRGEIKLGDLKMIIESNGSFSFAVEK